MLICGEKPFSGVPPLSSSISFRIIFGVVVRKDLGSMATHDACVRTAPLHVLPHTHPSECEDTNDGDVTIAVESELLCPGICDCHHLFPWLFARGHF